MGSEDKEIKIRVSSDTSDAIRALNKLAATLASTLKETTNKTKKEVEEQKTLWQRLSGEISSAFSSKITKSFAIGTIAANVFSGSIAKIAEALKFVVVGSIKASAELETLSVTLGAIVGKDFSGKLLSNFKELAETHPVDIKNLAEGSIRLKAMGIENEKLASTMRILSNLTAMYGEEKLPFLVLALGQVTTKTKLYAQELRQFQEAGVPLLDRLSKEMDKKISLIQKGMETGDLVISSKTVLKILTDISNETDVLAARSKTLSGQWKMLKTDAYLLGSAVGNNVNPFLTKTIELFRSLYTEANKGKKFSDIFLDFSNDKLKNYLDGYRSQLKKVNYDVSTLFEGSKAYNSALTIQAELTRRIKLLEDELSKRRKESSEEQRKIKEEEDENRQKVIDHIKDELKLELAGIEFSKDIGKSKVEILEEEISARSRASNELARNGFTETKLYKDQITIINRLNKEIKELNKEKSEEKVSDKIKKINDEYKEQQDRLIDLADANGDYSLSIEEINEWTNKSIALYNQQAKELVNIKVGLKSGSEEYDNVAEKIEEVNSIIIKLNKSLGTNKSVMSDAKKESFLLAESIEALTGDLADLFTGKFESSKLINVLTNELSKSLKTSLKNSLSNIGEIGITSVFQQMVGPALGMFGLQLFGNILTEILGQKPIETVAERTARIADDTFKKLIDNTNDALNDIGKEKNIVDYIEQLMKRYGEDATFEKLTQQEQNFFKSSTGLSPTKGTSLSSLLASSTQVVQESQLSNVATLLNQISNIEGNLNYEENLKITRENEAKQRLNNAREREKNRKDPEEITGYYSENFRDYLLDYRSYDLGTGLIEGYKKTLAELRPQVIESAAEYTSLGSVADVAKTPKKTEIQKIDEEYNNDLKYANTIAKQYGTNSEEYYNAMLNANNTYSRNLLQQGVSGGKVTTAISNVSNYEKLLNGLKNPSTPVAPIENTDKISEFEKAKQNLEIDLSQANKYPVGSSDYYEERSRAYRRYGDKLTELKIEGGTGVPGDVDSIISGAYSNGTKEYNMSRPAEEKNTSSSDSGSGINISASDLARYANDPAQLGYLAMGGKNTKNVSGSGFTPSYLVGGGSSSGSNAYSANGLNVTINVGMLLGNQNDAISIGKQIIDAVNRALASGQGYKLNV
jgi:tape measure domain-containing protein